MDSEKYKKKDEIVKICWIISFAVWIILFTLTIFIPITRQPNTYLILGIMLVSLLAGFSIWRWGE